MNEPTRKLAPVNSIWQNKITGTRVIVSQRVSRVTGKEGFWSAVRIKLLEEESPELSGLTTDEELATDFQRVDEHQINA